MKQKKLELQDGVRNKHEAGKKKNKIRVKPARHQLQTS